MARGAVCGLNGSLMCPDFWGRHPAFSPGGGGRKRELGFDRSERGLGMKKIKFGEQVRQERKREKREGILHYSNLRGRKCGEVRNEPIVGN